MMRKYDVLMPGSVCTVQVFKFHRMPVIGESETVLNQTTCSDIYMGGCAYNIWKGIAKLGASTYPFFSYRGELCEKQMKKDCEEFGAPADALFKPEGDVNYHCLMFQDDRNDHITISIPYGKDIDKEEVLRTGEIQYREEAFRESRSIIFVLSYDDAALELAKKHGLTIAYSYRNDPILNPDHRLSRILREAHIIFTNEVEAEAIEKKFGMEKITELFETGNAEIIVTTLGARGSLIRRKKEDASTKEYFVESTPVVKKNIDTVGAGDGYVAGFMYGYLRGKDIMTCARYGSTVSSFVIEEEGSTTNLPTLEQMLERNGERPDAGSGCLDEGSMV